MNSQDPIIAVTNKMNQLIDEIEKLLWQNLGDKWKYIQKPN
jgi:hypothetical protein